MTGLIIAALVFFWAVGAYNRLVRLRAACAQQFAVVDAQFVRLWAWVQGSLPASVRDEEAGNDKAPTALTEVWVACEVFAESLAQARATPWMAAPIQRVNIARGFAAHFPILLLDEPTASLDTENRNRVLELIAEARGQGSAILAVFHDEAERRRACSRSIRLD